MTGGGLDASLLHAAFQAAADRLAAHREAINAINVYPVPDGDTGTNMLLTLRAALDAARDASHGEVAGWGAALARGALLGARGNSGVILSQMLRGFATSLATAGPAAGGDGIAVARALEAAAATAYAALSTPVEGTMLTVLREAATAAELIAGFEAEATPLQLLAAAATEAEASVARTPELLPRLRAAGVVDSGGLGVAVILEGLRRAFAGEPATDDEPVAVPTGQVALYAVAHEGHGICTEYVIEAPPGGALDRDELIAALSSIGGESVLAVGDAEALHVHVHLPDPEPAIAIGRAHGAVSGVKTEDMQAQHEAWRAAHESVEAARAGERPAAAALGLVAVANGAGIAEAFRQLGATVVEPPDGAKPSARELLEAARATGAECVLLLPNDPDVLLAAQQAADESGHIAVVPARSVAAGLSAAMAFTTTGAPEAVARAMTAALGGVRTIEVTRAARAVHLDGVEVAAGDPIALLDGTLLLRADEVEGALVEAVRRVEQEATGAEIVTVYLGADAAPGSAGRVRALIEAACPSLTVEVITGGQPHYPFIAGVE